MNFVKSSIKKWFPDLLTAIKLEQKQCQLGKLTGDRKQYATYLKDLSAEKIAIISMTELMRVIFL